MPGTGAVKGGGIASYLGTFPTTGAVHYGTTQPAFDTGQGLVSALGGALVHPLEFSGGEIVPTPAGTSVTLQ